MAPEPVQDCTGMEVKLMLAQGFYVLTDPNLEVKRCRKGTIFVRSRI